MVIARAALRAGECMLVKASIAGAIVANTLFMLGASFQLIETYGIGLHFSLKTHRKFSGSAEHHGAADAAGWAGSMMDGRAGRKMSGVFCGVRAPMTVRIVQGGIP